MLSQGSHTYSELTTTAFLLPALPSLETGALCSVCHPVGRGRGHSSSGSGLPGEQGPRLWASCCLTASRSRACPTSWP